LCKEGIDAVGVEPVQLIPLYPCNSVIDILSSNSLLILQLDGKAEEEGEYYNQDVEDNRQNTDDGYSLEHSDLFLEDEDQI
jgi:hypothetical protein